MTRSTQSIAGALALSLPLAFAACGDEGETQEEHDAGAQEADGGSEDPPPADASAGEDADPGAASDAEQPVYALASQVFGPSEQTTYLVLHQGDLFDDEVSLEGGIERAGRALVASGPAPGSVFYAGDQVPEVVRYALTDDTLKKEDSVSFMSAGVMGIAEYAGQLVMVSESKALYFDARTLQVLVWNPEDMTLTTKIDISDLKVDGFTAAFSTSAIQQGDNVYMPVGYRTPVSVPEAASMVIVDTGSNTATIAKDDRCGYVRDAVLGEDGYIYVATEAFGSAVHYLNDTAAPAPCLLRVDPETSAYDPDFMVELNPLADGSSVGSLIKLPNGKAYVRVLDESRIPEMDTPSGRALASARAWTWSEITLGDDPQLKPVDDAHVAGGSLIPMPLGDKLVVPDFAADLSATTLCDMTEGPFCARSITVDGLVFSAALVTRE